GELPLERHGDRVTPVPLRTAPATLDGSPVGSLDDDLEEADFFVTQGLVEQARELLEELLVRYPNHALVTAKLRDLGSAEGAGPPVSALSEPDADADSATSDGEETAAAEPSRRAVVEKQIGEEDFETHYDLGIAYKEMGLLDDAIHEFRLVMRAPGR